MRYAGGPARRDMHKSKSRGGLGEKFSPGIFSPDQPTTLLALGVGGDEREEPISE